MNKIRIEGNVYTQEYFESEEENGFAARSSFHRQLYVFLKEWFSAPSTLRVRTSGSTGAPKELTVRKEQMRQSAKMTCDFFGLKKNDKALLCLPLEYIAGKMMVVRAIYAGLDLYPVAPDGHPLARTDKPFDFAALVPLQVYNSLQSAAGKRRLSRIKSLIIGGGAIDDALEKALEDFPNAVYSTYGMTETLSHIALRRINGTDADRYYTPLPGVGLALSEEQTLIIDAPLVANEILITNDIAELRPDGRFRIIGRKDNVINSGGIKIQLEEVERVLRPYITGTFAVTCIPHPKLGEAVVLLLEPSADAVRVGETAAKVLPHYWKPLHVYTVAAIPQTGNGKTDRKATKLLAEKISLPNAATI